MQRIATYAGVVLVVALPIVVVPPFLDYAQGAKTVGLTLVFALTIGATALFARGYQQPQSRSTSIGLTFLFLSWLATTFFSPHWTAALSGVAGEAVAIGTGILFARLLSLSFLYRSMIFAGTMIAGLGLLQIATAYKGLVPAGDPGQFPAVTFGNRGLAALFVGMAWFPCMHYFLRLAFSRDSSTHRAWSPESLRAWSIRNIYGFGNPFDISGRSILVWLAAVALTLQSLFIILAMTRSIWLGICCGLIFYLGKNWRRSIPMLRRLERRVLLGGAVAAAILGLAASYFVTSDDSLRLLLLQRLDAEAWTSNPRFMVWSSAITHWWQSDWNEMLLGLGPGVVALASSSWLHGTALQGQTFLHLHNDPLQALLEFGVLGFIIRSFLVLWLMRRAWTLSRSSGRRALASAFVCFAVVGLFFYPANIPYMLAVALTLAVASAQRQPSLIKTPDLEPMDFKKRAIYSSLAVLCFLVAVNRTSLEVMMGRIVREPAPNATLVEKASRHLSSRPSPAIYPRILLREALKRSRLQNQSK